MSAQLSEYVKRARLRFPRSYRDHSIHGDGRFAVLTCSFMHPSAGRMCYSDVYLFSSLSEAESLQRGLNDGSVKGSVECHAATKGLCRKKHELVDLGPVQSVQEPSQGAFFKP